MTIKERLQNDLKVAMKSGAKDTVSLLRFLHSAIRKKEIDDKIDMDDAGVSKVVQSQIKQRKDSVREFEKGGRTDLVAKELAEIQLLEAYMPEQMSQETLQGIIQTAIRDTNASSPKDMGRVMKEVLAKVGGSADSKTVSELVKKHLSGG